MNEQVANFFQKRGIDPETADKAGVTSENSGSATVIVFPFREGDRVVNRKYRGANKKFWQDTDGKKTFWNSDAITAAVEADHPLVITEGEMDALSVLEAGYPYVVSVPDGAPSTRQEDYDPEQPDVKFAYVQNNFDRLSKLRKIILAGDSDEPGKNLNHELVRRLGSHCCKFVTYPEGSKDLNEVLVQHGALAVRKVIDEAKDYPVKGLYTLDDYPDLPAPETFTTGMEFLDAHIKLELGRFMVVTGVPGHGKSELADVLAFNMAMEHGWKSCIATFENPPKPHWRDKLARKWLKCDPKQAQPTRREKAYAWVADNFSFISQSPTSDEDDDLSLENIIDLAQISVIRHGVKMLILDPWNEIEHSRGSRESETDYANRAIRQLKRFAKTYGVLVIVVAHPSKMNQTGKVTKPHLYDISGSAHWYNKADYGLIVWRPDLQQPTVELHVAKIKNHDYMGKPGIVDMDYDVRTGGYHVNVSGARMDP